MLRLPVLFDVDGVLNDFTGELLEHLHHCGHEVPPPESFKTFKLSEHLDEHAWEQTKRILSGGAFWRELKPISQAQTLINLIQSRGREIFFVTSPWRSCKEWRGIREWWLNRHFGAKASHVVPISDKWIIRGAVLVEDKAANLQQWLGYSPHWCEGLLLDQPWNRDWEQESFAGTRIKDHAALLEWFEAWLEVNDG